MLTQIEFENFRGFRKLALDGLQRVNLIVGRNNSGKTSLLEGIAALLNPGGAAAQFTKLRQLEEDLRRQFSKNQYAAWVIRDESRERCAELHGIWAGKRRNIYLVSMGTQPGVVTAQPEKTQPSAQSTHVAATARKEDCPVRICVIPAQHSNPESLVQSFGSAILRSRGEELLEAALSSVDRRIKKVRSIPIQKRTQIVVDIGLSKLVPLSQVGQGTYRLVEMFSVLIGAGAQAAFVDEVENGIHHSCLIDVWKGIAEAAQLFGVQVFATTHSHECIEAAHTAFIGRASYDFAILQLFRESGEIQGRVLNQQHITAAIAGDIDLRA